MEKKITEQLFNGTAKKYDSKHIKNLSAKVIGSMHINDIEQHGITSEALDSLARKKFPVCRYRTQLTIHGTFPEGFSLCEGGYKNVFRNGNGSLGVRYTAVDRRKKSELFALVRFAEPDFWRIEDSSTEYCLYHQQHVTTADEYKALKERAEQINAALSGLAYANVSAYLAQSWGMVYGVIVVHLTSFYQNDFGDILLAIISGHSRYTDTTLLVTDYHQHLADERKRREEEHKAWQEKYAREQQEREEKKRKAMALAEQNAEQVARQNGFVHFDEYDCRNKQAYIISTCSTYEGAEVCYMSVVGKNKVAKVSELYEDFSPSCRRRQIKNTIWRDVWVKEIA